jgi:acyl-coenzyme A thioesterase PaaI-like protein
MASAMKNRINAGAMRRILNLWPPFLCNGIRVIDIAPDWRSAQVELRSRPWNRNYVGVHFGGNLFSMTDPFWMLLTMHALGSDYIVWDQAAAIEFLKPGRGTVHAGFTLDDAALDQLRDATAGGAKHLHWFETDVVDASGEVVARVRKQVYVRRKRRRIEESGIAEPTATEAIVPRGSA